MHLEEWFNDVELYRQSRAYDEKIFRGNLKVYLYKISDEALYSYNVYQIEGEGRNLFSNITGDKDTIMGLPVFKIKEYLKNYQ